MRKITMDEEIELTDREEKIFKKGSDHGFDNGLMLGIAITLIAVIISLIIAKN